MFNRAKTRVAALVATIVTLLGGVALGQLPVATGQQIAMSRSQWKLFVPDGYEPPASRRVNLLVHFHGDPQTVWNNAAYAELDAVVVTVNYSGLSSAYSNPFADSALFGQLLEDARTRLSRQPGFGPLTRWDRLGVSSFSAGYGAVRRILANPFYFEAIDALLAADSLYATTASDGTALDSQMVNYKAYASAAAAGDKRFIFTHSEVPTFTYESTAETGDELLQHLGLPATATQEEGLGPLRYYRKASQGGFELWGAEGADAEGHLNHLRYLGEWLDDLGLSAALLPGDYNGDGVVDVPDHWWWRDAYGQTGVRLAADGNGDGAVDAADYTVWRDAADAGPATAIPEASAIGVALVAATAISFGQRSR